MDKRNIWEIYWGALFPDFLKCHNCKKQTSTTNIVCDFCNKPVPFNGWLSKVRPVLLFQDQSKWDKSLTFAIPLSTTNPSTDNQYNHPISLTDYSFLHSDSKYHRPMRAQISYATRILGNAIQDKDLIGKVTNKTAMAKIGDKLNEWVFVSYF